jgi:uncharacterized protein (DUF1015 family)
MIPPMATIRPFHGLRYSDQAGSLADLTAPPYDVISSQMREELGSKSQNNIVMVTLPEQQEGDRSKFIKYARSAQRLQQWRDEGVMEADESPCLYRYTQVFEVPGTGEVCTRTKLITLIKLEKYENNVVLPHERTFPKHKEDRMRILEATRSHVECIFGLFEDNDGSIHQKIASSEATLAGETKTDDGITHKLELISDEAEIAEIQSKIGPSRVWIADGHHRYETALSFREALGDRDEEVAEDYMMMALTSISDPGLVLLPTHRILKKMPISGDELKAKMAEHFEINDCPNSELMARIEAEEAAGRRAFGVALPGGNGFTAAVDSIEGLASQAEIEGGANLKNLDVSILHGFIFAKLLGLTGHDFFGYTRSEEEAVEAVEGDSPAAFLMNPPTVHNMREVAADGDFMPQKSTYYYPKLLSGLVVWQLKDD